MLLICSRGFSLPNMNIFCFKKLLTASLDFVAIYLLNQVTLHFSKWFIHSSLLFSFHFFFDILLRFLRLLTSVRRNFLDLHCSWVSIWYIAYRRMVYKIGIFFLGLVSILVFYLSSFSRNVSNSLFHLHVYEGIINLALKFWHIVYGTCYTENVTSKLSLHAAIFTIFNLLWNFLCISLMFFSIIDSLVQFYIL